MDCIVHAASDIVIDRGRSVHRSKELDSPELDSQELQPDVDRGPAAGV
jgi:hypothetical protein